MAFRQKFLWLTATAAVAIAGAAYAKEAPFYIELGTAVTQDDAALDWKELKGKYKQLRGLSFAAQPLAVEGEATMYRIQAGPVKNKDAAFKICGAMLTGDDECFVVQTEAKKAVGALPSKRRTIDVTKPPGAAKAEPVAAAPSVKSTAAASAIDEALSPQPQPPEVKLERPSPLQAATPEPAPEPVPAEGTVAVSEAIRVPLSQQAAQTTAPITETEITAQPTAVESILIGYFAGEQSAIDFWRAVREKMPQETEAWHVRTRKPLARNGSDRVTLSVESDGDISADAAAQVCSFATGYGQTLTCLPQQGATPTVAGPTRTYRSINATGMSREEALSMQNPDQLKNEEQSRYTAREDNTENKSHWAQLGTANSRRGARELWDDLQAKHGGLFKGYQPYVNSPVGDQNALHPSFRLRTGPFKDEASVEAFCRKLQAGKVSCLAVEDY